uniref:ATP-dependent Clp protease proteolytic subunit n=2 Tax=Amphilophium TaxID=353918 RepID=A0A4P9CY86_9LAMI|nr:clp protease proteolytic subunit [Amphilophium chocoense]YP_009661292.1 clp protease proteolytic subunit [Amphilophium cuneifolium]QCT82431.1 clp protease proteolytic subunit [Amphilophium chocoense]QCT82518.1 clp protease proteolytic subunit [Amphilophium cuneifolium]
MPVGLPKVPFLILDEDEEIECNGLYQRRILILGSEITSENANILSGALIFFGLADSSREFKLLINSPGGSVIDGIAISDTIDTLLAPVETAAVGVAASMACFILNGGTLRTAFPHARVMMHQPSSSLSDVEMEDTVLEIQAIEKIRDYIIDGYRRTTLKSRTEIMDALEKDIFMSAIEAKEYRLVDRIVGENGFEFP